MINSYYCDPKKNVSPASSNHTFKHLLSSVSTHDALPNTIADVLQEKFVWQHDEIQRELDKLVVKAHDDLYDLNRISDQQDKANLLSTDTSVFQLVPRTKVLRINNEALVYLAKQLFGKSQRRYIHNEALVAIVGHGWIRVTYT